MAKIINENTAKKVKLFRNTLGMTQGELALQVGLASRQSIKFYEMGLRTPQRDILMKFLKLAKKYKYDDIKSIDWFF